MEELLTETVHITNVNDPVRNILSERYSISDIELAKSLDQLNNFLSFLKDDLYIIVEHPYVDKIYRDSYYHYYASKGEEFSRNCIRLSFFSSHVIESDFFNSEKSPFLREIYLGFLVIRPTFPFIIGRNVISPKAFKNSEFAICNVAYNITVNGLKMSVNGFPHCSQDSEIISCAETTIWSVLEYFGNRYPEYTPTLPSKINKTLSSYSFQRLTPTNGLTASQISYLLKEFGFGVKIYSRDAHEGDFIRLLKMYIESGIPVIGMIRNSKIGHALTIVGRELNYKKSLENISPIIDIEQQQLRVYDYYDLFDQYVFIDDNYPPYQLAELTDPTSYYENELWEKCAIHSIAVPLYHKIYMVAEEARMNAISILKKHELISNKQIIIRTLLASSRSYKHYITQNTLLAEEFKKLILSSSMPKFIWIAEIIDKEMVNTGLCSGIMIFDATEPKRINILAALVGNYYIRANFSGFIKTIINKPIIPFTGFYNNLSRL
jgi:hypothetical protein